MPRRRASEARDPKIHLTEAAVQRLSIDQSRRREIGDAQMSGLVLRITPTGSKTWSVLLPITNPDLPAGPRRTRRATIGRYPAVGLRAAREKAQALLQVAAAGRDPIREREQHARERETRLFKPVVARFIDLYAKPNQRNWKATEHLLKMHVVKAWGDRAIDSVTRRDAHELLDGLVAAGKLAIAREVRKHITKLFNWAADRDMIAASPLAGLRRRELGYEAREKVLDMDELRRVWDAAGTIGYPFGTITRLLILTGQRRGEIAAAKHSWFTASTLEIPASAYQTGRAHTVPLGPEAAAIVKTLPRWTCGEFVFSTKAGRTPVCGHSNAKERLDKLSGVTGWTIHDIRRSVATHMARLGVPADHIERVLGHVIPGVAGVYNRHAYAAEKRAALELWGRQWA